MVGLRESWCFCKGVSKSERTKAAIFSGKSPATVRISGTGNGTSGAGFLIHRNLLLTTHVNLPSSSAAEIAEIRLHNGVAATLVPHRFFITSSVLDLTIVGLDSMEGDSSSQGQQQPQYLKTCSKPSLDLGCSVYLLGYTDGEDLTIGEGKVVIATDNLIKLSADVTWSPASAGFDAQGNLAFMVCDPMKLATSPPTANKSGSTSSSTSSSRKDLPTQFGIPIPIVCDWLYQHWEGSLDDVSKPKLPIIRLMSSAGPRSDHSSASFTMRRVFKSTDGDDLDHDCDRDHQTGPTTGDESLTADQHGTHVQGIPTPEIYESPKLMSDPVRQKQTAGPVQLLDINFPPKPPKPARYLLYPGSGENFTPEPPRRSAGTATEVGSSGSLAEEAGRAGYSSDERETMYSAETAESRNYTSPREGKSRQQVAVGRSQSCVSYSSRWGSAGPVQRNPPGSLENQRSFAHGRKIFSPGAGSQRSNDYYSPTVSSIMKKRNGSSEPSSAVKPKQSAVVHSSPKWNF